MTTSEKSQVEEMLFKLNWEISKFEEGYKQIMENKLKHKEIIQKYYNSLR